MSTALHGELTADGSTIVLVAAADDWETERVATALRQLTPLMRKSQPRGALLCPATWTAVTQLASTFSGGVLGSWIPGPRLQNWIIAEFTRRTAAATRQQIASEVVPDDLTARPYQLEAAAMIAAAGKIMISDDPGCGKTVSTILGLKARSLEHDIFPLLIIVPSWDIGDVWTREIARWAPDWKEPAAWGGPVRWTYNPGHADTYLTTYATARRDAADASGPLMRFARWSAIVLDEHHALKNDSTKQSSAARRLTAHAGTVVALSGTPVTRDTGDIYPVLAAMDPASWPSKERFRKRYCLLADGDYEERIEGLNPLTEREFRTALLGQLRRVAKADVLDQLPPKVYSVRRVEIPPEWRAAYDTMEQDMLAQLPPGDDGAAGELPVMSTLAQLTRLSQLASSACDVAVTEEPDENGVLRKHYQVTLKQPCWTADALLGILAERPGHPVAVFAPSRQLVMLAGEACEKAGYRAGYITGRHTRRERTAAITAFQGGQLDLIAVTTGAGGQGITLTAADTVVFLKRPWPLEESIQAEDRAHRIGAEIHDSIEIIDIVTRDTVDERIRAALREKSSQLADFVQDPRIVRELLGGLR